MAIRKTDTDKWHDPWFSELSDADKLLWIFLCDNCDTIGVWKVNKKLAEFHLWKGCLDTPETLGSRVKVLDREHWFLGKFVKFQYGNINASNNFHKAIVGKVIKLNTYLKKNHSDCDSWMVKLRDFPGQVVDIEPSSSTPIKRNKDKEKEKNKEGGIQGDQSRAQVGPLDRNYTSEFELFWNVYPKKTEKDKTFREWKLAKLESIVDKVIETLEAQKKTWNPKFIKNPCNWIKDGNWHDEVSEPSWKKENREAIERTKRAMRQAEAENNA